MRSGRSSASASPASWAPNEWAARTRRPPPTAARVARVAWANAGRLADAAAESSRYARETSSPGRGQSTPVPFDGQQKTTHGARDLERTRDLTACDHASRREVP